MEVEFKTSGIMSHGITIGAIIAVVMSWEANHSILWAVLHGIFSWFYILYRVLF